MSQLQLFLLPIFLHVIMVFFLGIKMAKARVASVKAGRITRDAIATNAQNWPEDVRKIGNNFDNQFDLPTTWYAASALIIATSNLNWIFVALSWAFLISRICHTYFHIGENVLLKRKMAYQIGIFIMGAIWVWFAVNLYAFA